MRQSDHLFWTDDSAPPGVLCFQAADGSQLFVASPYATTSARLIQAEKCCLEWGESLSLQTANGTLIQDGIKLGTGPYRMTSNAKRQRREKPQEFILVTITHHGVIWVDSVPAGTFIFQILRQHELHLVSLIDDFGVIYGADHRLWSSAKLRSVDAESFPTLRIPTAGTNKFPIAGAGIQDDSNRGLNEVSIWNALQSMTKDLPSHEIPTLVHPQLARAILQDDWTSITTDHFNEKPAHSSILCIFEAEGHWAVLHGALCGSLVRWNYMDGIPDHVKSSAALLAVRLSKLCHLQHIGFYSETKIKQVQNHTCGTIALLHSALQLGFLGDFEANDVNWIHEWLFDHQPERPGTIVANGPPIPDLHDQIATLLQTKGVPANKAAERSQTIASKIGHRDLFQAMNSKNPWQSLKALASRPQSMLRLVLPEELSLHVDAKAKNKFGAAIPNAKGKKVKSSGKGFTSAEIQLEPELLQLDSKHFKDVDGDVVTQISFQEVEVEAAGIALCTFAQAEHFLASDKIISSGALALLLLQEPPKEVQKNMDWNPSHFQPNTKELMNTSFFLEPSNSWAASR